MAHATHPHTQPAAGSALDVIASPFQVIWSALTSISESTQAAREIERLSVMNDAQLAELGLSRGEIARKVMNL